MGKFLLTAVITFLFFFYFLIWHHVQDFWCISMNFIDMCLHMYNLSILDIFVPISLIMCFMYNLSILEIWINFWWLYKGVVTILTSPFRSSPESRCLGCSDDYMVAEIVAWMVSRDNMETKTIAKKCRIWSEDGIAIQRWELISVRTQMNWRSSSLKPRFRFNFLACFPLIILCIHILNGR